MIYLVNKNQTTRIVKNLKACEYHKTGDQIFIRQINSRNQFKVALNNDQMNHNILLSITMEILPTERYLEKNEKIIYQKGTFIAEELGRLVEGLSRKESD